MLYFSCIAIIRRHPSQRTAQLRPPTRNEFMNMLSKIQTVKSINSFHPKKEKQSKAEPHSYSHATLSS